MTLSELGCDGTGNGSRLKTARAHRGELADGFTLMTPRVHANDSVGRIDNPSYQE
jgi:hypothetical protein